MLPLLMGCKNKYEKKKSDSESLFFHWSVAEYMFSKGMKEKGLIGKHSKKQQHLIKNASWKSKLIKRLLCLSSRLRWVESYAWFLILSCFMMRPPARSSRRPRRRGWKTSWGEPPWPWYNKILTWFFEPAWFRSQATAVPGRWWSLLISMCLGTQTKTHPGVPTYPAVLEESWWGGRLLQFAENSQTEPSGQVHKSRYDTSWPRVAWWREYMRMVMYLCLPEFPAVSQVTRFIFCEYVCVIKLSSTLENWNSYF